MPSHAHLLEPVARRQALFPWALAGGALIFALTALSHYFWAMPRGLVGIHSVWMDLLLFSLPILFTFQRARAQPEERAGWIILGISSSMTFFAACLALAMDNQILGAASLGRPGILIRLAAGALLAPALLAWPLAPATASERRRKAMDGLVFALALFFTLWAVAWGDIFRASRESLDLKFLTLAFPLTYIIGVGVAIYLGARNPARFKGPLGWITLALMVSFVGNLAWGVLALRGKYYPGHVLDLTSFCIPLIRAMAPLSPEPVGGPPTQDEAHDTTLIGWALPYLSLIPALAVTIHRLRRGATFWDPVLIWTALAMGLALLIRQFLAMRDLKELSVNLEQKVEARTAALEQSQSMVLSTVRMNAMASLGAGLAHDLNNLIGAARNYNELAREELADGQLPEARHLNQIEGALGRAGDLTARLMAFGRAEEDRPVSFELGQHLRDASTILGVVLPRSIRLELDTDKGPLTVVGHPAQLDQILVNLVSNARDAMPQGGRITLRARQAKGHMAQLEVEDTGHGMSPEVQDRIFEAFFTTKPKGKGTGLGLASVRALVARAGGEIQLWSVEGQGTRFTLTLPLAR